MISMTKGDTESIAIRAVNPRTGEPIPFEEGDTVFFTVKFTESSERVLFQKRITEFEDGAAVVAIFPEDTKPLEVGKYRYDGQLTDRFGNVYTIVKPSDFVVTGEVTWD